MSEEVKDIMENLKESAIWYKDSKILLDYITNLQNENERLMKLIPRCSDLRDRIDKAIDFINTTECYDDVYGRYMFNDSDVRNEIKELLQILGGVE